LLEHCCNNGNQDNCWNTLAQQLELRLLLGHIVTTMGTKITTMTSDHIIATVTLDTSFAFVIPFEFERSKSTVPLSCGYQWSTLPSSPMLWCEHLWNFSVLQRVHLSNLVHVTLPHTALHYITQWFLYDWIQFQRGRPCRWHWNSVCYSRI
jgi:hypothetical protein